jgi:hypothetical protein
VPCCNHGCVPTGQKHRCDDHDVDDEPHYPDAGDSAWRLRCYDDRRPAWQG